MRYVHKKYAGNAYQTKQETYIMFTHIPLLGGYRLLIITHRLLRRGLFVDLLI